MSKEKLKDSKIILKNNKSDKTDKPDKTDKSDKPDKTDKSDKSDKTDKSDKSDKTDKSDKPDKPDKPDKTDVDIIHKERLRIIDIIFDLYPELKKNKEEIVMNVFEKYGKPIKYILTKYIHNNNIYYIDPDGIILDKDINFKGLIFDNNYYFNEEEFNQEKINEEIKYFDKLMNRKN